MQQLVDDLAADAGIPCATFTTSDRTSATDRLSGASSRAGHDPIALKRHDESVRMHGDLPELARQQVSFGQLGRDQRVNRTRIGSSRRLQRDSLPPDAGRQSTP